MEINISRLADGTYQHQFDEPEWSPEEDIRVTDFHADCVLSKAFENHVFKVHIRFTATVPCDRCLSPAAFSLEDEFTVTYSRNEELKGSDPEGDFRYLAPDQNIIDLRRDAEDSVRLALPMKAVCSEDCKGLCPECGKNKNMESCTCGDGRIDPRWEKLLNFKKN